MRKAGLRRNRKPRTLLYNNAIDVLLDISVSSKSNDGDLVLSGSDDEPPDDELLFRVHCEPIPTFGRHSDLVAHQPYTVYGNRNEDQKQYM